MKKILALFTVVALITSSLASCKKHSAYKFTPEYTKNQKTYTHCFTQDDTSPFVSLSQTQKDEMLQFIDSITVDYEESDIYQTEECYNRLNVKSNIEDHKYSALNENGILDAMHLEEIIKVNNEAYLSQLKTSILKVPDTDTLSDICGLIVNVINDMKEIYPDVDYDRVYCNLGNLKVLQKGSMINLSEVTNEMVLHISETGASMKKITNGEDGYNATLIHEVIHIMQFGCSCEQVEHCVMRVGPARSYDDFEVNTTKLEWLYEGSAELIKNNLLGMDKDIYVNLANYVNTLNLSTVFNPDIPARYAESICLYDDIDRLYNLFECESKEDKLEILNMLITMNVIQFSPDTLIAKYGEKYGVDIGDSAVIDNINYTIKPDFCMTITKNFYKTIAQVLEKEDNVTLDDLCFMVSLYESAMNYHLRLTKESLMDYNAEYLKNYKLLREKLFKLVSESSGTDVSTYFNEYSITDIESGTKLSASMKWNDPAKNEFLLERVDFFESELNNKIM